jgi:hypothetical protein
VLKNLVSEITFSDKDKLKQEKINEFEHGIRPNGNIIGQYRDPLYQEYKYSQNPLAKGNVDLMLTHSFANKLFLKPFNNGFIFDSSDTKRDNLVSRYDLDIMGINQDWFNNRQANIYRYTFIFNIKRSYKIA